jgi:hypothetical protein
MATTPEGKVKDKIKTLLKSYAPDVYYFMPAMGSFGKSGVPDIIACIGGRFVAIEVKADRCKNPPTALQEKNLAEIRTAGGVALVIDGSDMDFLITALHDAVANARKRQTGASRTLQ